MILTATCAKCDKTRTIYTRHDLHGWRWETQPGTLHGPGETAFYCPSCATPPPPTPKPPAAPPKPPTPARNKQLPNHPAWQPWIP